MNTFNRLLIILLALVLLVAAGGVLLTTLRVTQPAQLAPSPWFADRLGPFTQLDPTLFGWTVGVCLVLIVVALVLLFLELRPEPRSPAHITLKEDGLGRVTVPLESVRKLVDWEAGHLAGVTRARSQVTEGADGVQILCRVSVAPASNVPDLTQELQERIKSAVQHDVGVAVTEVSVDAQVAPLVTDRRRQRRVQ
jgi:uncharacterized alkaline shock family protein YloU